VWLLKGPAVTRIDPRTHRPGQRIPIGSESSAAIAVGAGSGLGDGGPRGGAVGRIEPGPSPEARTIDVSPGVSYIAFGARAVWADNYIDDTLARIDPGTNAVTKIAIGAAGTGRRRRLGVGQHRWGDTG
jgi:hypothetical protein